MATKVKAPVAAVEPGADDLQVLHPERSATIAGRTVVVREYGFIEGLRLRGLLQPLVEDLHAHIAAGGSPEQEHLMLLFGAHADRIQQLIAIAADVDSDWVASLSQADGYHLLSLWWGANNPFCWFSVLERMRLERVAAAARAGQISTPPSSPQAMEQPTP